MCNVGVEIGQLLFIAVILAITSLLKKLSREEWRVWLRQVPAYAIGGIAAFSLIERVAGF